MKLGIDLGTSYSSVAVEIKCCSGTLQYLKMHPSFLKTYFKYMQLAQAGDAEAKQLVNILVSSNPELFIDINDLLKMANEGDAHAKQVILDNLKYK